MKCPKCNGELQRLITSAGKLQPLEPIKTPCVMPEMKITGELLKCSVCGWKKWTELKRESFLV